MNAYAKFSTNNDDYASWLQVLYSALQAIYAFNYLGATPEETGPAMQNQIKQFFDAVQLSANSIENSSSAYGE